MIPKAFIYCAAVFAAILTTPVGLSAAPAATEPIGAGVTSQMKEAKQASYELRDTADSLYATSRICEESKRAGSPSSKRFEGPHL